MPKFNYFKVYKDISSKEEEMKHLRDILPSSVGGEHFKDIAVLNLYSDREIDFLAAYGSTGWELDQEPQQSA
jgi:hypothetical protein